MNLLEEIGLPEDIQAIKTKYAVAKDGTAQWHIIDLANRPDILKDIQTLIEAFENEYHDVLMLSHNVSRVYDHITCSRISKPNTKAEDVIAVANDFLTDVVDDAIEEATVYFKERITKLEKSLVLISDIAYDQDGYADVKSLSLLIEELRLLALKALREKNDGS